jgi:hypothetical protein
MRSIGFLDLINKAMYIFDLIMFVYAVPESSRCTSCTTCAYPGTDSTLDGPFFACKTG